MLRGEAVALGFQDGAVGGEVGGAGGFVGLGQGEGFGGAQGGKLVQELGVVGGQGIAALLQPLDGRLGGGRREAALPQVEQAGVQGGQVLVLVGVLDLLEGLGGGGLEVLGHAVGVAELGGFAVQLFEAGPAVGVQGEGMGGHGLGLLAVLGLLLVALLGLLVFAFGVGGFLPVVTGHVAAQGQHGLQQLAQLALVPELEGQQQARRFGPFGFEGQQLGFEQPDFELQRGQQRVFPDPHLGVGGHEGGQRGRGLGVAVRPQGRQHGREAGFG